MEKTFMPNIDSTETLEGRKMGNLRSMRPLDYVLRFLAVVNTMVAAITMGAGNETKVVPVTVLPNLPPVDIEATAKWQYKSSSYVMYFMATNIVACVYATLSLVLLIVNRARSRGLELALMVLDLVMVALLFSDNGAVGAVGLIGYNGNSHVQWKKVCNVFNSFCHKGAASIAVSMIGSMAFMMLIVLAMFRLHNRSV
ncbi:hypothetical protein GIB67_030454 [Kingdonia uniflora]|uniref:CASP-like protein n=1 Tax=Kingdonia uniflora TaxID=39325 RepID=A0A7J7P0H9_9MAGN|nr:hypothetical protein GIB67_035499 [Kingdonia uniflora]KAF6175236.1 hypothetical protein GIB67_030454 [Kingdonia uniflora]